MSINCISYGKATVNQDQGVALPQPGDQNPTAEDKCSDAYRLLNSIPLSAISTLKHQNNVAHSGLSNSLERMKKSRCDSTQNGSSIRFNKTVVQEELIKRYKLFYDFFFKNCFNWAFLSADHNEEEKNSVHMKEETEWKKSLMILTKRSFSVLSQDGDLCREFKMMDKWQLSILLRKPYGLELAVRQGITIDQLAKINPLSLARILGRTQGMDLLLNILPFEQVDLIDLHLLDLLLSYPKSFLVLMKNGWGIEKLQTIDLDQLEKFFPFPSALELFFHFGISFEKIMEFDHRKLELMNNYSEGVRSVLESGFGFDEIDKIDAEKLPYLMSSPKALKCFLEMKISLSQIQMLSGQKILHLLNSPEGVRGALEVGITFEDFERMEYHFLDSILRSPEGLKASMEFGMTIQDLEKMDESYLSYLLTFPDEMKRLLTISGFSLEDAWNIEAEKLGLLLQNMNSLDVVMTRGGDTLSLLLRLDTIALETLLEKDPEEIRYAMKKYPNALDNVLNKRSDWKNPLSLK